MRLGLNLGYWGPGPIADEQLRLTLEAERLGYDSVWVAEAYGSDGVSIMAWLAVQTSRIGIGSAIMQIPARTPTMTAMTAATLDALSGGRFRLGLGVSGPQVTEGWYGQPFDHPLGRTREYIDIIRLALSRQTVRYDGQFYRLPRPGGEGKALKMILHPLRERIPIYLAAMGPKNVALTAEIADGWIPLFFAPEHAGMWKESLEEGAARSGRDLSELDVAPFVAVAIGDNLPELRDRMRPMVALYVGGMGSEKTNFYNRLVTRYGFGEAAAKVQAAYLTGDRPAAMAAVPDELIDMTSIIGPKEKVKDRLAAYRDAGVGTMLVAPAGHDLDERLAILRTLAELNAAL